MPSSAGISRKASQNAMTSRPPSSQQKTSTTTLSKLPSRPVSAINKTPSIPPSRPQTSDVIELSVEETPKPIEEVIPEPVIPIEVSTVETQEQSWNKQHQIPTFQQLKKGLKRLRVSPRGMQVVFTSLDLQGIGLTSLDFIRDFVHIQELNLSSNSISDLAPLSALDCLTSLTLSHNAITHLPPTLPILQHLDLSHNQLRDIPELNNFTYLVTVNFSHNQIQHIESNHRYLEKLELRYNQISDIAHTGKGLLFLDVSHNRIERIRGPAQSLVELYLENNQIRSLSGVEGLKALQLLDVRENPLNESALEQRTITPNASLSSSDGMIKPAEPEVDEYKSHGDQSKSMPELIGRCTSAPGELSIEKLAAQLHTTLPYLQQLPALHILDMPFPASTRLYIIHNLPSLTSLSGPISAEDKVTSTNLYSPSRQLSSSISRSQRIQDELRNWKLGVEHWLSPHHRPGDASYMSSLEHVESHRPILIKGDIDISNLYRSRLVHRWPHCFAEPVVHKKHGRGRLGIDYLEGGEYGAELVREGEDTVTVDGVERIRRIGKRCVILSEKNVDWGEYQVKPHKVLLSEEMPRPDEWDLVLNPSDIESAYEGFEQWAYGLLAT